MSDSDGWSWLFGKLYAVLNRNPKSNRIVAEHAGLKPGDKVLDIGCGAGAALTLAAQVVGEESVTGLDPTQALASTARKRVPGARVEVGIAEDLPFPDRSFTVVWTIASFHHWDEAESGLREIRRVLTPGGRLLVAERRNRRDAGHGLSDAEARSLEATLGEMGFVDVSTARRRAGRQTLLVLTATRLTDEEGPDQKAG